MAAIAPNHDFNRILYMVGIGFGPSHSVICYGESRILKRVYLKNVDVSRFLKVSERLLFYNENSGIKNLWIIYLHDLKRGLI